MKTTIKCPNCTHEFVPVGYSNLIVEEDDNGILVSMRIVAGFDNNGFQHSFRLETEENIIEESTSPDGIAISKVVRQPIEWTRSKIIEEAEKRLDDYKKAIALDV